ncbi:unnamed protein product [Cylicocyclus nassatus]|uniref:RING-type domain-containing protein n=1 Tax=Cylicocyclus nassatus TaxID=53992 RepID=A0AA36GRZ3_CYLNA|nr:unnamed protein product [Cylicocyclus nassatus]
MYMVKQKSPLGVSQDGDPIRKSPHSYGPANLPTSMADNHFFPPGFWVLAYHYCNVVVGFVLDLSFAERASGAGADSTAYSTRTIPCEPGVTMRPILCGGFYSNEAAGGAPYHGLFISWYSLYSGIGQVVHRDSMAPVTARRAEARKMKAARLREEANLVKSSETITETKDPSKPTCFFDESLLACDICLEIMHNAMNVSPCNHKFCAGCIYEWNSLNTKCPKCRWSAADITRDATLNSIIEQYLTAFPEKRRDKAQLIELDERELNHLEQWERKRDSDEGDYDYEMEDQFFDDSDDSDSFEVQDEQLESDDEDALEYSNSDRWSDNMIGSFDEDDDENDSDIQHEYISRRNLEKARMERLRREKEERDRLKELEAERSRKTSAKSKKEKSRDRRCGTGGGNGRSTNSSRSNTRLNNVSAPTSTRSVTTHSMTLRSRNL